ncbi:twin-arginine translocation pathway signal [Asticcacaulis biprosthecium C19]|uniref:Twin-arginine translocation pathway signal n=1 Tax=Asticcacaulis biprosthecium C19 TaxID=715226 RepID=F4QNL3_9CAUL|nr:DUF3828 domain-containing protein [Asticcacaulis biprosthecium]EGF90921.1 twin-arginine translocation pathway signal [Asticcacaulis biprosthecium C19]
MQRRTFLISVLAMPAAPAFAQTPGPSPEQILRDLYALYKPVGMAPYPDVRPQRLMTTELAVLYTVGSTEPDNNLPPLDWDIFVNGQDFGVTRLKLKRDVGTVTAKFDNLGEATTIYFDFIATPDGWRIDNVRYPDDENGPGFDLRRFVHLLIATPASDPEPASTIVRYYRPMMEQSPGSGDEPFMPFTAELEAQYDKAVQDSPDGEMPLIDWDIFVSGQDARIEYVYVVASDKDTPGEQTVTAFFANMGTATAVIYDFVKQADGWRIRDVRYPENETFPQGFSLTAYIENDGVVGLEP